ncbi:exopolyphosphatase / guanosine-5'-triphosphate,3'-diphosphate pyrophosphatase [Azospirillaceae bacterium]
MNGGRVDGLIGGERQNRFDPVPNGVAERPVFAALDLGTNNCRLLIARGYAGGFRVIDAFSRIVRLGEGLSRSDRLTDHAMERTLAALRICGTKIRRRGVTVLRAVATEACRRAANCDEFIALANRETGITIEIISSAEEGRLALAGCAALLDPTLPRAVVFDIGGGSTEIMWLELTGGRRLRLLDQISVRHGVVSLAEQYGGDRISSETYREMVATVSADLAAFEQRNRICEAIDAGGVQMLGTSGTVTTLASVNLGLMRYERSIIDGSHLSVAHARAIINHLMGLDFHQRAAHPCIGYERADLVVAGCAVLEALCNTWPFERLRIADRGLREGILTDFVARTWD